MLRRDILRPEARALFQALQDAPELAGLTLIGGTALALQIGHRVSLDFDFACFDSVLPTVAIDSFISRMKSESHRVQLITDPGLISVFKINTGENLLHFARDYVVDGVKLTFFTHGKNAHQRSFYQAAVKVTEGGMNFDVLGLGGMKVAKTLVLADRVRSRDLYDCYVLMRDHAYTVEDAINAVRQYGTLDDPEYYKSVFRGEIPLDKEDEGLEAVGVFGGYKEMYTYFDEAINEYETVLAKRAFEAEK